MWKIFKNRGVNQTITAIVLTALMTGPVWATSPETPLPGPAIGSVIAGAAMIGALVIAKWWRRK